MNKVLIAGGSGMVGRHLSNLLKQNGYTPLILTRQKKLSNENAEYVYWDISKKIIDPAALSCDYVVNLSGSGIADKKWTPNRKKDLINSRTESIDFLIFQLAKRKNKVKTFISASAIGYYGDTGERWCDETSQPVTDDFLSHVCQRWEEAGQKAKSVAEHLTILRISTVLSKGGGALEKMDKTIPFGVANYLGSGQQYMSWIHIEDLSRMIIHCIKNPQGNEIYNASAPEVMTNYKFTDTLRKTINSASLLMPAPKIALKLLLGEMSAVVLNSSRIKSEKIRETGFKFNFPLLADALKDLYKK